jgi:hypothetical protein
MFQPLVKKAVMAQNIAAGQGRIKKKKSTYPDMMI